MEGEKRACQKKVVHGMELDSAHRGDDEHQEKEEKQRDRRGVTDFTRERPGLKLVGHGHPNLKSGDQVGVSPSQVPAVGGELFGCGRKSVVGEVDVSEVSVHGQCEVTGLSDSIGEFVAPAAQTL